MNIRSLVSGIFCLLALCAFGAETAPLVIPETPPPKLVRHARSAQREDGCDYALHAPLGRLESAADRETGAARVRRRRDVDRARPSRGRGEEDDHAGDAERGAGAEEDRGERGRRTSAVDGALAGAVAGLRRGVAAAAVEGAVVLRLRGEAEDAADAEAHDAGADEDEADGLLPRRRIAVDGGAVVVAGGGGGAGARWRGSRGAGASSASAGTSNFTESPCMTLR